MKILYGYSSFNRICFATSRHLAVARLKKDSSIEVTVEAIRDFEFRCFDPLEKIPFIRGIVLLLKIILKNRLLAVFFLAAAVAELFLVSPAVPAVSQGWTLIKMARWGVMSALAAFVVRRWIGPFHAAEHMAAEAFTNNNDFTEVSVMNEGKESRNCGSNMLPVYFLCVSIAGHVFPGMQGLLLGLAGFSLSYEVVGIRTRNIILDKLVLAPGMLIQKYITTTRPEAKHIRVAIAAINALREAEPDS